MPWDCRLKPYRTGKWHAAARSQSIGLMHRDRNLLASHLELAARCGYFPPRQFGVRSKKLEEVTNQPNFT
jgi:hypothetical protein